MAKPEWLVEVVVVAAKRGSPHGARLALSALVVGAFALARGLLFRS